MSQTIVGLCMSMMLLLRGGQSVIPASNIEVHTRLLFVFIQD
jgi:hypothetical protein